MLRAHRRRRPAEGARDGASRPSRSTTACPSCTGSRTPRQGRSEQLRALLALVEEAFGAVHESIESLYHDLFIDTCDPWAIPYIADLLGTSHLTGDPQTLRRDVALTIRSRRRKGTLGAIEEITEALTGWGVPRRRAVQGRRLSPQQLDHQRPDAGGLPPYALATVDRHTVVRGGTGRHPRPGHAGAARHAVRPLRAHAGLPGAAHRDRAREPAEPGDLPLAAGRRTGSGRSGRSSAATVEAELADGAAGRLRSL